MLAALRSLAVYVALPFACLWVWQQERRILRSGAPLDTRQLHEAQMAGVNEPQRIRVRVVDEIPPGYSQRLRKLLLRLGMVESAGMCLRYGIYLQADFARNRRVLVHEMVHTGQYERLGGIWKFLRRYLKECLRDGYAGSELEAEAEVVSEEICR